MQDRTFIVLSKHLVQGPRMLDVTVNPFGWKLLKTSSSSSSREFNNVAIKVVSIFIPRRSEYFV